MDDTPTPRTAEAVRLCKVISSAFGPMVGADDMEKLERELNESRQQQEAKITPALVMDYARVQAERDHLKELHQAALTMYEQCLIVQHQYEAERDQIRKVCDELAGTIYVHSLRPQNALDGYNQLPHVLERKTK